MWFLRREKALCRNSARLQGEWERPSRVREEEEKEEDKMNEME